MLLRASVSQAPSPAFTSVRAELEAMALREVPPAPSRGPSTLFESYPAYSQETQGTWRADMAFKTIADDMLFSRDAHGRLMIEIAPLYGVLAERYYDYLF